MEEAKPHIDTTQKIPLEQEKNEKTKKRRNPFLSLLYFFLALWKWAMVTMISILIFLLLCLSIPSVQEFLGQRASEVFSQVLGHDIMIKHLKINLLNQKVNLDGLTVYDNKGELMIQAEVLEVKINPFEDFKDKIVLHDIIVKNGQFNLIQHKNTDTLNIVSFVKTITNLTASDTPKDRTKAPFGISKTTLDNMAFSYRNDNKDSIAKGFDYHHFRLEELSGTVYDFKVGNDTIIELRAEHLTAKDLNAPIYLEDLTTLFRITKKSMEFNDIYAIANNSIIQKNVVLSFDKISDLSDFVEKVKIKADLKETKLDPQDIALFATQLSTYKDIWSISTQLEGTVNNFYADSLILGFGENSRLRGRIRADGLPDLKNTLANIQLETATVYPSDLRQYVQDQKTFEYIQRLGKVTFKGRFDGFVQDFVANGNFNTALGQVSSDLHLVTKYNKYNGSISLSNFNMGTFLDNPSIQTMTLRGKVKGQGFNMNTLKSKIDLDIKKIGILGYNYQNIKIDGDIKQRYFDGILDIKDRNATAQLAGKIDLRKTLNPKEFGDIQVEGRIEKLDFEQFGFADIPLHLSTTLDIHTKGLNLEDIVGNVVLKKTTLDYGEKHIEIDSVYFDAFKEKNGMRFFDIDSDLATIRANGNFSFDQLGNQLKTLYKEYLLGIKNNTEKIAHYYRKKRSTGKFSLDCNVNLRNINPILQLFEPNAYISPNTTFEASFSGGDSTLLKFQTMRPIDSLVYKKYQLDNVNANIESYKSTYKNDILAEININSSKQSIENFKTENLNLNAIWEQNIISFQTGIKQQDTTNHAFFEGIVLFEKDSTIIEFLPSFVNIADMKWEIKETQYQPPYQNIVIHNDEYNSVKFDKMTFGHEGKKIIIDGIVADSAAHESLGVSIENFDMSMLNEYFEREITGTLFAEWTVKDIYNELKVEGTTDIEGFGIGDIFIGHLSGKSTWDPIEKVVLLKSNIYSRVDYIMFLDGKYGIKDQSLDFLLELRNAQANIIEPFVDKYISQISGQVSGKVKITGTLTKPKSKGYIDFNQTQFKVNYLGTNMKVSDKVHIYDDEIKLKRFKIYDQNNHVAIVDGSIFHNAYQNMYLNFNSKFDNFIFIDTKEGDNELYYGTAILTGDVAVTGKANDIKVTGNVSNEYGTKLYVPLDGYTQTSQKDYIQFVDFDKTKKDSTQNEVKKISLNGFTMDLNLDINEEAYMEIIFDKRAGDIIKGRGEGKIQMAIDSKGDFSMYGDYFIKKGTYNFTMMNLVNKKFNIQDNSRIYFLGNLYNAEMQVFASYSQPTSLAALLDPAILESGGPELKRRYPTSVMLELNGPLLSPDIKLDIDFKDAFKAIQNPILRNALISYQALLTGNEQELNRQAFSLILLKTLSAPNSFSGVQSSSGRNLSELLSNQLSHWMSQVDENLQIDVDLLQGDTYAKDAYQVTLTYTFLDGRLRVTRDGLVDTENQDATANIVGEWTVEYLLTKNGKYRLKMYNRNTPTAFGSKISGNTTTTAGFSVSQTQTFDNVRDLLGMKESKKKKEKDERKKNKVTTFERQLERKAKRSKKRKDKSRK